MLLNLAFIIFNRKAISWTSGVVCPPSLYECLPLSSHLLPGSFTNVLFFSSMGITLQNMNYGPRYLCFSSVQWNCSHLTFAIIVKINIKSWGEIRQTQRNSLVQTFVTIEQINPANWSKPFHYHMPLVTDWEEKDGKQAVWRLWSPHVSKACFSFL